MTRRALVALLLGMAAASLCGAGTPSDSFTIGMSGRLLAVGDDGDLYFRNTFEGAYWYVMGTQIKSSVQDAGYLAYDPKGETNLVGLVAKPGKGTQWNIDAPGKGKNDEGKRGVIRAAVGPKKGWYLTVADGSLVLVENPPQKLEVEREWKH